ncbi:transcription initiation factor TFIIA small subunit [Marchantia polymorpha subsp. ruderalis]
MSDCCELYRKSSIGVCLIATLEEMIFTGKIDPLLAMKVLMQFDKSMKFIIPKKVSTVVQFRGHLQTYRFCDKQWSFFIKKAMVKINRVLIEESARITIFATDAVIN